MDEQLKIIKGRELSEDLITQLNDLWIKVYEEDYKKLQEKEGFKDDLFFILYQNDAIVSFGRFRPITFTVQNKEWSIQGIADIASVEKGKGWGKKLILKMKEWLEEHNEVGIGFCEPDISAFYEKCGFKIYPRLTGRFWYVDKWSGNLENYESDVLYYGSEKLMNDILEHPEEKILIPYPW